MKREILFRAQLLDSKEWIEGYYYLAFKDDSEAFILSINDGVVYQVNPETVCQFTGLTDKNGTKIFESDIIKATSGRSYVIIFTTWTHDEKRNKFLTDRYEFTGWCISKDGINPCDTLDSETLLGEKIGNIYDNSELLK